MWDPNITWLANKRNLRTSLATASRSQSLQQAPSGASHQKQQPPSFDLCKCVTDTSAYSLNTVPMDEINAALRYADLNDSYEQEVVQCVIKGISRLLRSLHAALTSGYTNAVCAYCHLLGRAAGLVPPGGGSSPLLAVFLREKEHMELLVWAVSEAANTLLGIKAIHEFTLYLSPTPTNGGRVLANPNAGTAAAIRHALEHIVIPLVSSCPPDSSSSSLAGETRLKEALVEEGFLATVFDLVDYVNVWLAGGSRFVGCGLRCSTDRTNAASSACEPLKEDTKLIEMYRLRSTGADTNDVVAGLVELGRAAATTLIHLLKTSKATKRIFLSPCTSDGPTWMLRCATAVFHASDPYLQLQLCEALVRAYSFDRNGCQQSVIPADTQFLSESGNGSTSVALSAFYSDLMHGIASLPTDATLITQCRRMLRGLEDRQRGPTSGSPNRAHVIRGPPPLTSTFEVLRAEYSAEGSAAISTLSQRGGELFRGDDGDEVPHFLESATVVFTPLFFVLRPPATEGVSQPPTFVVPHDRITNMKLTRDKRFGFRITPTSLEAKVLALERANAAQAPLHPSDVLADPHASLDHLVEECSGGGVSDGTSDVLRLLAYMQRCDMSVRPTVYSEMRQNSSHGPDAFMLYLCTTAATIAAITNSNVQIWIKKAKAASTSMSLVPEPPAQTLASGPSSIGRNQNLVAFIPPSEDIDRQSGGVGASPFSVPASNSSMNPAYAPSSGPRDGSNSSYPSDIISTDPQMFALPVSAHSTHPSPVALPLRGLIRDVADEVSAVAGASRYHSRLAVLERYKELIAHRTEQHQLNHRLRRQEFENIIVKPVFESVLNALPTNIDSSSIGGTSSTLLAFDSDLKQAVGSLNGELESIELIGDAILTATKKLREECGDGLEAPDRRRRSLGGKKRGREDDGAAQNGDGDSQVDRQALSPVTRANGDVASFVLRDVVKGMERRALEGITARVEGKLSDLENVMKEVLARKAALNDPSHVIRSFAERRRAEEGQNSK